MNKLKPTWQSTESDLSDALDQSVEVAVALGISELDLLSRLLDHWHCETSKNTDAIQAEPPKKMFNPLAGP